MLRPWETQFWLEDSPGKTLHARLLNTLTRDIKDGRLAPGDMLPGSRSLAEQLGVNRKTVQQVYEELEDQGWLLTRPRSGTYVSENLPEQGLTNTNKNLIRSTHQARSPSVLVEMLYQDAVFSDNSSAVTNDGTPDSRLIPYELLARTYRRVCINLSRHSKLGYGDPRGTMELRQSVKKMLSGDRFMNCSVEQICIVRGSQMGIYLASRILDPSKGAIVMEELCYPPARAAFESNGFKVLSCKLDHQGLDIDNLKSILAKHPVAAVFVTPHHQYPSTVCLPMDRRLALLDLSKTFKFAVLEDDYDHEFHYGANPIPPLASLPNSENVVHIGSMSKVFAPGLRLGYIAADSQFIERAAQEIVLIDRQGNTVSEIVLSDLMESGEVRRHIRKIRKQYEKRRDFAAAEFKQVFGDKISFTLPTGGMAIWINISKLVRGRKLNSLPGKDSTLSTLYTDHQSSPTHLRFGFGALSEAEIRHSILQLSEALK
ncbi:PLP-dependent aminotransferase family protein [Pseudoteredinibacter isoporae]|uniref:GntR family transcriptional regulator/MocR family aminotransferase n=1 Tax=Pseudoteredinibacter isoporae TaxID=570281 RepID=A0A7X0JVY6_9GAMM|nr:PLP-dependent aminotransferase family protein [Pseudoteredinibacter isoporae]MBB6522505.1 GntR family transcriptional regulator/MocR family aminotransferase [Pseudoteredinibacter isoporae]NHO88034.1 PLP-dependent aminotransferase family protein [Pseudoteredinibacter isoporae]NIB23635.1 PLP-dependent aminotransferase family protein [Pseudoteredinibacter isoporae]